LRAALSVLGIAAVLGLTALPIGAQQLTPAKTDGESWLAVAPGLIEPRSGEIKVMAQVIGPISDVLVSSTDEVITGELLIRLDDQEARARLATAQAQVALRKRARNDQSAGKGADRRKAEDAVADAEAALVEARDAFDNAAEAKRVGSGSDTDLARARSSWTGARDALTQQRAQLRQIEAKSETPLPSQVEGQLNIARSELRLADVQLEKLRIRAPIASTVLQVKAKVGELAAPSAPEPLLVLGDLSALRVRAELDERDVGGIKLGEQVVVRADGFRGREFAGKVSTIAPIIQAARIISPGSRNLTDVNVAEVQIDLADPGPLKVGMKVDVYFPPDGAAK
jgi:HlyD family secretion protein